MTALAATVVVLSAFSLKDLSFPSRPSHFREDEDDEEKEEEEGGSESETDSGMNDDDDVDYDYVM